MNNKIIAEKRRLNEMKASLTEPLFDLCNLLSKLASQQKSTDKEILLHQMAQTAKTMALTLQELPIDVPEDFNP